MNKTQSIEFLTSLGFKVESYKSKAGTLWRVFRNGKGVHSGMFGCGLCDFATGVKYMAENMSGEFALEQNKTVFHEDKLRLPDNKCNCKGTFHDDNCPLRVK